jgi:hypothetical protein
MRSLMLPDEMQNRMKACLSSYLVKSTQKVLICLTVRDGIVQSRLANVVGGSLYVWKEKLK